MSIKKGHDVVLFCLNVINPWQSLSPNLHRTRMLWASELWCCHWPGLNISRVISPYLLWRSSIFNWCVTRTLVRHEMTHLTQKCKQAALGRGSQRMNMQFRVKQMKKMQTAQGFGTHTALTQDLSSVLSTSLNSVPSSLVYIYTHPADAQACA